MQNILLAALFVVPNVNAVHSFQTSKGGKKRITSCQTKHYNEDFTSYTVCKNKGANLTQFEMLFYSILEKQVKKLTDYVELINTVKINEDQQKLQLEKQRLAKEKQVKQWKTKIRKIGEMIENGVYDDDPEMEKEKYKEIDDLKSKIKSLAKEVQEDKTLAGISEAERLDKILYKMKQFLLGKDHNFMSEKEKNELLGEFIETIIYQKLDDQIHLKMKWKDDIDLLFNEVKNIAS